MENIERSNIVYYQLYCAPLGTLNIAEPLGWVDDVQSLKRDNNSKSIRSHVDIKLKFYGESADWLKTVMDSFGVGKKVLISKYEKERYSKEEPWKLKYVQQIDMRTFQHDLSTNEVSVKATEGGLFDDIKDRESEKYDLLPDESADGKSLNPLEFVYMQPLAREIFVESLLEADRVDYPVKTNQYKESYSDTIRTIPMKMVYNSDTEDVYEPYYEGDSYNETRTEYEYVGNYQDGFQGHALIYKAVADKSFRVVIDQEIFIENVRIRHASNRGFKIMYIITETADDGRDRIIGAQDLLNIGDPDGKEGNTYLLQEDRTFDLLEGQSLAICFNVQGTLGDFFNVSKGWVEVYMRITGTVRVIDKTDYEVTLGKGLLVRTLLDRILAKITGKEGLLRSEVFGPDGDYSGMVIDNGFWARGFPDEYNDNDGNPVRIQFATSWKDALDALEYLEPMAWFVETEGTQQVVRVEPAKYTQQNFIGVDVGTVDKVKVKALTKDFFGTIELGHKQDMEYEDINGLDEFNGLTVFNSHLFNAEGTYKVHSPYRTDAVRYELTRRKRFEQFPKEDTPGDDEIWMHDCKFDRTLIFPFFGGIYIDYYTHKTWQDLGYDQAPTGIYSPDTAFNLNLSPMNRLVYGHGYSVKRGLYHNRNNAIRFSSSNANQNLITVKNGITLEESGAVRIGDIENNRVKAEEVEVTFNMTQELEQKFLGFTEVNGKQVPNYFGLVKYNKNGLEGYGRITQLTNSREAKLKLIKAGI